MAVKKKLAHINFSRVRDIVKFPGPEDLNEITYVASATNFRRCLLNQYGNDSIDIDHEIETNPDTMLTYLGYRRFLVSDLQYIFPLSENRSKTNYKKNVKFLAKQMLIRGYVSDGHHEAHYNETILRPAFVGVCWRCEVGLSESPSTFDSPIDRRAQDFT